MIVPSRDLLPISSSYCDCCDLSGEVRMVCVTVTVILRVSICRDEKCELVAGHLVLVLVPVCGSCSCCLKALGENGAVAACSVGWLGWAGLGWAGLTVCSSSSSVLCWMSARTHRHTGACPLSPGLTTAIVSLIFSDFH